MSKSITETVCETVNSLVEEAKSKYEERKVMMKYAKEIATELADEEISVPPVEASPYAYAFGEAKKPKKPSQTVNTNGGKSSKELVLEFINNKTDKTATSADINKYFHELGKSAPAPTLTALVKEKLLESVSRGVYKIIPQATKS